MENNKVFRKVRNLLALANHHNTNSFESVDAAKKAEHLMKKFKIELREVEQSDSEDIILATYEIKEDSRYASKWEYTLAEIVARCFRCETCNFEPNLICFYGFEKDAKLCVELFKYLYVNGNKLSERYYKKFKRKNMDKERLMYTYLFGFCNGVQEVLDKQCTALMLAIPQIVKDSFREYSKGFNHVTNILEITDDENAYCVGRREGKDTIYARSIESQA